MVQELTAQVDEAIKSGENFEDVTRYSETVVEARLIPAYRKYIRQIEDISISGNHIASGMVEVVAALPDDRAPDRDRRCQRCRRQRWRSAQPTECLLGFVGITSVEGRAEQR